MNGINLTNPVHRWPPEVALPLYDSLHSRQQFILRGIAAGESNTEIAARIGIADKSLEKHITKLYAELNIRHRVEAGVFCALIAAYRSKGL